MTTQLPCILKRTVIRSGFVSLLGTMENLRSTLKYKPSTINISTMTIVGNLSVGQIDTKKIIEDFRPSQGKNVFEYMPAVFVSIKIPEPSNTKKKDVFLNQVTFFFEDFTSKKSFKIFSNGKLHGTGCKSPYEFVCVATSLCNFLKPYTGMFTPSLDDFSIAMMNSNFSMRDVESISLKKLTNVMRTHALDASNSFETHAAVRLSLAFADGYSARILVYKSGAINIMGVRSFEHMESCIRVIVLLINEHYEDIKCERYEHVRKTSTALKLGESGLPISIESNLRL